MSISLTKGFAFLIVLFYIVGFLGFISPYSAAFKQLVPFHLLLMFGLMLISHPGKNRHFLLFIAGIYLAGYLIELAGVRTGMIFGSYFYESTLGLKLAGIPLLIGINWILVIYPAGVLVERFGLADTVAKSALAAFLVTLLDFFIEPVAVQFDYWEWKNPAVPVQNYIAWFVISFLMFLVFFRLNFSRRNGAAIVLFITQLCFFIVLSLKLN